MSYLPQLKADRAYKARLKEKGIKDRHIWLDDQQWEVVHAFAKCVRKIKKLKYIVGFDVSDDFLNYHIVIDETVVNGGVVNDE